MDFGAFKIAAATFRLAVPREFSRLAGGQVIPHALGTPYWHGRAALVDQYHRDAAAWEVALMRRERPGQVLLVYDARFNGPQADPGGVILGAAEPVLHTVAASNGGIRIAGLPADYQISTGDYVGWQGADGSYALHRAAETIKASGGGLTPLFGVEPLVRPGTPTGAAVTLVRPVCRAIVPESDYGSGRPLITQGATFIWQQAV